MAAACHTPGRPVSPAGAGEPGAGGGSYEVQRGDTLSSIARSRGARVEDLIQANGLDASAAIRPGQQLVVPSAMRRHVVRRGETLWRIARTYGSSVGAIAQANGIRDVTSLAVGQQLRVPAGLGLAAAPDRSPHTWTASDRRGGPESGHFIWPVRGRVSSRFGMRRSHHHDGIDIAAAHGTPVFAAASGRVIHADDSLAGYGRMIIIKHSGRYSTVYAHNRRLLVQVGDFVERGQRIAEVGETGRASSPHLHFELRYDGRVRDPMRALP